MQNTADSQVKTTYSSIALFGGQLENLNVDDMLGVTMALCLCRTMCSSS